MSPHNVSYEPIVERLFECLINGNRSGARELLEEAADLNISPESLLIDVFWPTYEQVENLFRNDQLTLLAHNMATRLLRVLVDQNAARLRPTEESRRSVFAVCGPNEADELGAQMAVDLLEASGFRVSFAGGGIPNDEIMGLLHNNKPDVLLFFASAPGDLPGIRTLIDTVGEIGACRDLQICVGGGVFNRADDLAEEIGADLWASDPFELVDSLVHEADRRAVPEQRTVGRKRTAPPPSADTTSGRKAA